MPDSRVPADIRSVIDALPVTEHRARIVEAIRNHRVVIVSGETGSGKTTQLPKFCLEAGRGVRNDRTRRGGLIGHTQPRRIAASSVATRIAEEMGTPLGTDVGYKIRFNEKVSPGTRIKLMTDGILLAESQRDRLLSAYDTLIIDEAHERSLNIDFLLGYLKQLIDGPRRDDLKLIITSATIDAARFAEHFGEPGRPAPVIEVSGRLYPVEVRYRPPEDMQAEDEDDETDLPSAIETAVRELWNEKPGDVLVFLPGEREIRETAEHLQRAVARGGAGRGQGGRSRADLLLASAEIVPLYARLPAADQQRVFNPGNAPRIVLATNVAETSLTVPRIRYVIDSGLARMLLAGHRTGCLAEVLIITAALSVQDPRERPPTAQQAADQAHARFNVPQSDFLSWIRLWRYWQEQQAGRKQRGESHRALANRIGREFLSIRKLREWADVIGQLTELVRGLNWQINTDEAAPDVIHRALLTGLLGNVAHRLPEGPGWQGTHQQKFVLHPSSILNRRQPKTEGGKPAAPQNAKGARWLMAAELVDTGRLQARTAAAIRPEWVESAAGDLIQRSWSNPHWEKNSGKAMAHERGVLYGLVLYTARRVPYEKVDPVESRRLMIRDGLVTGEWPVDADFIRHNRKVIADVERLEHKIRRPDLLVDEESLAAWFDAQVPAGICNARDLQQWYREAVKADAGLLKLSREALLKKDADGVDEARFPRLLRMRGVDFTLSYHFEPGAADDGVTLTVPLHALNQVDADRCEWLVPGMLAQKVSLLFKSLPQRWRRHLLPLDGTAAEFLDGLSTAKASAGETDSAPAETGAGHRDIVIPSGTPLIDALLEFLRVKGGWRLAATDFRLENIPAHLQMNFRLVNEHGRVLAVSRRLSELQAAYGSQAQSAFQNEFSRIAAQMRGRTAKEPAPSPKAGKASPGKASEGTQAGRAEGSRAAGADTVMRAGQRHTRWDFGTLPELLELQTTGGERLVGFPALLDKGDAVEITVYDDPAVAERHHRQGVVRLFALAMNEALKSLARDVKKNASLELGFNALPGSGGKSAPLAEQLAQAAIIRSFLQDGLPQDDAQFQKALADGRPRMLLTAQELARLLQSIVTEHGQIRRKLTGLRADRSALDDIEAQLAALFPPGFLHQVGYEHLQHYPRYLKAVVMRLDKLREDPARDKALQASMVPLLQRWRQWQRDIGMQLDREAESFRWMLEELRVSLFAQSLRTPMPVSVKRLTKVLDQRDGR